MIPTRHWLAGARFKIDTQLGIRVFVSDDAKEGSRASAEKRKPEFKGHRPCCGPDPLHTRSGEPSIGCAPVSGRAGQTRLCAG